MGFLESIIGGGAGNLIESVGKTIDKFVTTSAEKEQMKAEMQRVLNEELSIMAKEMDSARNREIAINSSEHATWLSKNTVSIIALSHTAFTFTIYILILAGKLNATENIQILIINSITNIALLIVGYYFGSSQGASKNRDVLNEIAKSK